MIGSRHCSGEGPSRGAGPLTDGDATVGTAQVDVALGDGGHAQLVEGPAEEGGKGAGENHVAVSHGAAHRHTHLRERRRRRSEESGRT